MDIYKKFVYLMMVFALLAACSAKKDLFVLMPDSNGKVGEITVFNEAGDITLTEARESVQVSQAKAPENPTVLSKQEIDKTFHDAMEATPKPAKKYILYFMSDTTNLTRDSKNQLPEILQEIEKRIPCDVSIVGHSDTRGGNEYNLNLSRARANEVKKELLAIGVNPNLIEVAYHGEADLLTPTDDDVSEPKNRRAEVIVR